MVWIRQVLNNLGPYGKIRKSPHCNTAFKTKKNQTPTPMQHSRKFNTKRAKFSVHLSF